MSDPLTGNPEWIELCNPGGDTADLMGLRMAGNEPGDFLLTPLPGLVPPGGYAVVAEQGMAGHAYFADVLCPVIDPADWDALKRDGDIIVLKNRLGRTLDSLHYHDDWFSVNKGVSIERVSAGGSTCSPSNWRFSLNPRGATPGFKNSSPETQPGSFGFEAGNRIFAPGLPDGRSVLNLYLALPEDGSVTVRVYDLKGREVRTLCKEDRVAGEHYLVWDGRNSRNRLSPMGPYIVFCEYKSGEKTRVKKISVVRAGG